MNGVREVYIFDHINGTVGRVPIEGVVMTEQSKLDVGPRYEALRTVVDSCIKDVWTAVGQHTYLHGESELAETLRGIAEDLERAIGRPLTEPESPDA